MNATATRAGAMLVAMLASCTNTPRDDVEFTATGGGSDDGTTTTGVDDGVDVADGSSDETSGVECTTDDDCPGETLCNQLTGACLGPCTPGAEMPCYSGPVQTADVGACVAGSFVCTEQGTWPVFCAGEVTPLAEDCDNGLDDDCDGVVDDSDLDGDGFGVCTSDCCDSVGPCSDPELVNPGAYEVVGNALDDNCNGDIDEDSPTCDAGLASDSEDADDFARAMDLCQTTEEEPKDPADRTWGVISARLSRADGNGVPLDAQTSIRSGFGDLNDAERGDSLIVLSSGHAADATDTNPDFAAFEIGQDLNAISPAPQDWLAANGGAFPNPAGCPEPWDFEAHDPAMLTLRMRAPTNARSFSVRMFFFSAEYPEFVCTAFNDFFVALVDSTATTNPDDKNIAIYDDGATVWPVGVNLVMVADGLFGQCENGTVGCDEGLDQNYTGCVGDNLLAGTGFDAVDAGGGCGDQTMVGGGTGWLTMSGNVTPGEIFDVRFAVWDSSGHLYDALVLLDAWEWSVDAAQPGVAPG